MQQREGAGASSSSAGEDFEQVARQVFESAGWDSVLSEKKRRLQLASGANLFCIELDDAGRVYMAVTTGDYPTRYVFGSDSGVATSSPRLMQEFKAFVAALPPSSGGGSGAAASAGPLTVEARAMKKALKPFLKTLAGKFDDIEAIDKLAAVRRKVADVQKVMGENLVRATERDTLLSGLEEKSQQLETSAGVMFKGASALRRHACLAKWRIYIIIALLLLILGAVLVVVLNYTTFHWWQ